MVQPRRHSALVVIIRLLQMTLSKIYMRITNNAFRLFDTPVPRVVLVPTRNI